MKNITDTDYRPDIDGLRALAVLSVIAFHAFPSWASGGFIGVDVFFVVSGFLITRLIQDALWRQSFSFSSFYAGRVRRLFPSLIVVLLACQFFGWFALLSDEYKALGKHIAASTIFIPNFILWAETGYFSFASDTKPLLHLWSLGIEEQFYLVWPAMIWLALRYRISLIKTGVVLLLASLALNVFLVDRAASATFFFPMTRIWELLFGGLLACVLRSEDKRVVSIRARLEQNSLLFQAVSILGLVLVLAGVFFFHQDLYFPGVWALVPVLGTGALLVTGNRSWINRAVLSHRLLVWIGLISFPLYLWHWPLLSFARILEGIKPDCQVRIMLIGMAFAMAAVTFYLVERPIRSGRWLQGKTRILVFIMVAVGGVGLVTFLQEGFASRLSNKAVEAQLADLRFELPDSEGWYCGDLSHDAPRCHSTGPDPTVVVIGDSHALMIYSALRERFQADDKTIGLYGASDGCPPLLNVVIQDQGGDIRHCLKKGTRAIQRIVADANIKEVILTSRGPMYTTGTGFGDVELDQFGTWVLHIDGEKKGARSNEEVFSLGLSATLDALLAAGKKVTFLHDVPELGFDIRSCFSFRPLSFASRSGNQCAVSRKDFELRTEKFRNMVDQLLTQRPEIQVIDLAEALCDEAWCLGAKDGALLYIDDDHLSHRGAQYVVNTLWDKF